MDDYKRVPGGEKNRKSGVLWSKQELYEVYKTYKELGGKGIHERNPLIQNLAFRLKRTVRSTEAQALMYRNLERGGDYSHGNMNKLCKEIWIEMEESTMIKRKKEFPADLLDWAGHREGGVKKPFDKDSGRPIGSVIETKLTSKLEDWAKKLVTNTEPRIILLVGGPGNGKTDALEFVISKIDEYHETNFFESVSSQIKSSTNLPRMVSVKNSSDKFFFKNINIVQDASTGDARESSEACLIRDLNDAIKSSDVYLACINRGILAQALTLANKDKSPCSKVLNWVTKALSQNVEQLSLWPLQVENDSIKDFAVWPMDVESLVTPDKNGYSPAKQILQEAVDEKHWNCSSCTQNKQLCPFYQNKVSLQNQKKLESLVKVLRDFETISNKRWSFRELFSITAYILVGSEQEFEGKTPCQWSSEHISNLGSDKERIEIDSLWILNEHLYHFKLFSRWPSFNKISRSRNGDYKFILGESEELKAFFSYFAYTRPKQKGGPDVSKIIDNQFFSAMDPGQISNDDIKVEGTENSLADVESLFSYSVEAGLEKVKHHFNRLEITLFNKLIRLERLVDEHIRIETSNSKIDEIISLFRAMASRYFKRIYFTQYGYSKDYKYLNEFSLLNIINDPDNKKLKKAKRLFEKLIQERKELELCLNTSFAQPEPALINKIGLKVRSVNIQAKYIENKFDDVPRIQNSIFNLKTSLLPVPLTYQLYKALMMIDDGIRTSSLPEEVSAMLDKIKSRLGGVVVRDDEQLMNSYLRIGNSKNNIIISSAQGDLEIEMELNANKSK